jgi:hypothetical protein
MAFILKKTKKIFSGTTLLCLVSLLIGCSTSIHYEAHTLYVGPMEYNRKYYVEDDLIFNVATFNDAITLGAKKRTSSHSKEEKEIGLTMLNEKYSPWVFIYSEVDAAEVLLKIKENYNLLYEFEDLSPGVSTFLETEIQYKILFNNEDGVIFTYNMYKGKASYCDCFADIMIDTRFINDKTVFVPNILEYFYFFDDNDKAYSWMESYYQGRQIGNNYVVTYLGYDFIFNFPENFKIEDFPFEKVEDYYQYIDDFEIHLYVNK